MKIRFFRRRLGVSTLVSLLTAAAFAAGPRPSAVDLQPVELQGYSGKAFAGWHEVYENREAMSGRKIKLYVVVVPATGENPEPDPIFFFAGGPGDSAARSSGFVAAGMGRLLAKRDLVFLDQRGSGKSHPLNCDDLGDKDKLATYMGDMFPVDYVKACREKLDKIADLTQYVTDIAMDDANEVRAALGYDKINLMGFSYGSRAVMVYMRRHPQTVRAAMMGGLAPVYMRMPSTFAQDAQRALDMLIADCAADAKCKTAYPNLQADLDNMLAELKRKPVTVEIENEEAGGKERVTMEYGAFTIVLRGMLYSSGRAREIPRMVTQAANGDWAPFAAAKAQYSRMLQNMVSDGMYLSITCAEDIPYFDAEKATRAAEGTFLGDYRVAQQTRACKYWPRAEVPAEYLEPVKTDLPALLITGDADPVTPPSWGESVVKHFTNGRHLVAPNTSHSMGMAFMCVGPLIFQFFEEGHAGNLDASCLKALKRPEFALPPKTKTEEAEAGE